MTNSRKVTIDIDGKPRTCTITDYPYANEWPAGDPVPGDKEVLGFVERHKEE